MVKRSVINLNFQYSYEYAYIDHIRGGFNAPPSSWKTTGGAVWTQNLDSNGWPNYSTATIAKIHNIGAVGVPSSSDFSGAYWLDGVGTGAIQVIGSGFTISVVSASGVTWNGSNTFTVTDSGSGWSVKFTYSGGRQQLTLNMSSIDPSNVGKIVKNVRWYRDEDASDLAAGKIFKRAWKQTLVDLNPYAVRFMNWTGHNNIRMVRFEHRTLPSYYLQSPPSGTQAWNWVASPKYGETTGTNQWSLSSVTGTPASMQHGEIVTCRMGTAMVRAGSITVSAITKANPGSVTATAHGFSTGDQIVHLISAGMTQLDRKVCTITVVDANTYTIGIDTSGYTTFTSGTAEQFTTLQVGSGNDRTAYPITFGNGNTFAGHYGNGYIAAGEYKTFVFDKTVAAYKDSGGNWVYGVWIYSENLDSGHTGGTALEICTALVNELMAMSRTDGGPVGPIHMWITIPHLGLLSMDPDYSTGSNWAINAVDVVLNGANGYSGLNSNCNLYVEYSNETWNAGFYQTSYLSWRGYLRWPASGLSDQASMVGLRSLVMVNDIVGAAQNFPRARLKFVLSGQGTIGANTGVNGLRANGTTYSLTDASNVGGVTPISVHDSFAWAGYFSIASTTWETSNLSTIVTSWVSHSSDANAQEADCASYVAGFENTGTSGNETVYRYRDVLLPAYASWMSGLGKTTIMYEGGWDRSVSDGSTNQNNFMAAVKRSWAWSNKLYGFHAAFDSVSGAEAPADYVQSNARWGHITPDAFANSVNGVEWSGLDQAWQVQGVRNRSKRRFRVLAS